jgi:hypothetical protein
VNTHGLYDWLTRTWQPCPEVRTDFGIIIHLPADADGCELYKIDLERGWRRAQVCGVVLADQKGKVNWETITVPPAQPAPVLAAELPPVEPTPMQRAIAMLSEARTVAELIVLMDMARDAGVFNETQMSQLIQVAAARWDQISV